jgi:hypothetical protein
MWIDARACNLSRQTYREVEVLKTKQMALAIAILALALLAATGGAASAKTKKTVAHPTYEQAWALCTKEMDRNHILRADAGQRQAAGGACMHRHGYRL